MTLGVTGTRYGGTPEQLHTLRQVLERALESHVYLSHGDCVGVDKQTRDIWKELGGKTHCFPPLNGKLRAYTENDITEPQDTYFNRNMAIVDNSTYMISVPRTDDKKGGTWHATKYSFKQGVYTLIILPDGSTRTTLNKSERLVTF